jgi:hypothetical protein
MNDMNSVYFGEIVFLHVSDGSTVPALVIEVVSATEVKLEPLEMKPGVAPSPPRVVDKPVYVWGREPGQWEKMNEQLNPSHKEMMEQLRVSHLVSRHTFKLMEVPFVPQMISLFDTIAQIHENRQIASPFMDVTHQQPPFNNDGYFYELVAMGVQEGLRSSLHFLNQFVSLKNQILSESVHAFTFARPVTTGIFGITAHKLQAEYEGFIFLSRSTLDRLTSFLKYYFQNNEKRDVNLYQLEIYLMNNYPRHPKALQVIDVINRHRAYLDTQFKGQQGKSTERNRMAHQEYVGFATPNIRYTASGTVEVVLIYKGDLHADGAVELGQRYDELQHLILDMLRAFFDIQ